MKKIISTENGKITVRGSGAWLPIEHKQVEWSDGEEVAYFKYKDNDVFLSEVVKTDPRGIFSEYDGMLGLSYFSGLLIKLNESCDAVQAYYFYQG